MTDKYACDTCARAGGRMRGSGLYRCFDVIHLKDWRLMPHRVISSETYVPVARPVVDDDKSPWNVCAGWVSRDAVGR